MISLLFGLPGSGKSTLASFIAYRAINNKSINFRGFHISSIGQLPDFDKYETVYTNFPCIGAYSLDFDTLGYVNYHDCLMIIDEVQLFADSRNFKNFGQNLRWFFSMHRHSRIDIVLCTQSLSAVDARIRSLTQQLYYIDKLGCFIRVREIISYFDVNRTIQEGYDYASGFNTKYFYAKRLYKYNDTYAHIQKVELKEPEKILWDFPKTENENIESAAEIPVKIPIVLDSSVTDSTTSQASACAGCDGGVGT